MDIQIIMAEALLWSILWLIVVAISVRVFPFTIEHDYPDDVRKLAKVAKPSKAHKRKGILFGLVSFSLLFGYLLAVAILHYRGQQVTFAQLFFHLWLICMTWNLVDLLLVDWLFICTLSLKYYLLPGTEGYKGHKNYRFHLVGFVKGLFAMTLVALIFAGLSHLLLLYI